MTILHHLPDTDTTLQSHRLKNKVVLITGGGSGLGRHVAIECSKAGAKVIVTDVNVQGCIETIRLCNLVGGVCKSPTKPINVFSTSSLQDSIEFSRSKPSSSKPSSSSSEPGLKPNNEEEEGGGGGGGDWGWGQTPDVVVANAGVVGGSQDEVLIHDPFLGIYPKKQSSLALDINLQGVIKTVNVIRKAWKEDDEKREGSGGGVGGGGGDVSSGGGGGGGERDERRKGREIVLIGSMGGLDGIPVSILYSTAKHGVVGYWLGLCAELRKKGDDREFQCHVVCPFFSLTPILPGAIKLLLAGCPKVPPISVGETILSLLSSTKSDLLPIPSTSTSPSTTSTTEGNSTIEQSAGLAILLPDDKRAFVIKDIEYDVLSVKMYEEIENGIIERGITIDDPEFKKTRNRDILQVLRVTKVQFLFILSGICIGMMFICYTAYKIPTWLSVVVGVGVGMMVRMGLVGRGVVRRGRGRGRKSQSL